MRRARMFADVGLPGKACRLLCSRGVANPDDVTDKIQSLFPHASGDAITPPAPEDVDVDLTDVRPVLKGLQRGLAAGPSGLRADYLLQVLARNSSFCKRKLPLVDELTGALTTFIRLAVSGRFPSDLAQWLCAGRVVPCCKKDGGLRPVVVGEVLRSIVSQYVLRVATPAAQDGLPDYQLGFSPNRAGMQAGIFVAQHWAGNLGNRYLLKVDVKNAFNSIDRAACVKGAELIHEHLGAWGRWILHSDSFMSCGSHSLSCKTGVQQGEPLSPLLFCIGLAPATAALGRAVPGMEQQWFMDDGLLLGTADELAVSLHELDAQLRAIKLSINLEKCELYGDTPPDHPGLRFVPFVDDRDKWSYLGSPIGSNRGQCPCAQAAVRKVSMVSEAVDKFAALYPAQAMQILRYCLGACRVHHLCQTSPSEMIREAVITPVTKALQNSLASLLHCSTTSAIWQHASLPVRCGGLGLQDPADSAEAARLASLVNIAELLASLNIPQDAYEAELHQALQAFNTRWKLTLTLPAPQKDLQKDLTSLVHQQRRDQLVAAAHGANGERLISLTTAHATDWLTRVSPWFSLTPAEYRAALRWVLAVPVCTGPYTCPWCGCEADPLGIHAVSCSVTGAAGRGHSVVKFLLANLYRAAHCGSVDLEQGPAGSAKRPADLLVTGAGVRPLALDVTVWTRLPGATDTLDAVVNRKLERGKAECNAAGWRLRIWAADTYGAVHPATRPLLGKLISLLRAQSPWKDPGLISQEVWSALSAAILTRAASQHCRLMTTTALRSGSAALDAGDASDDDSEGFDVDEAEPVPVADVAVSMDTDGQPPDGEVLGTFNPQPDLLVGEPHTDPMDADVCSECAEAQATSSPMVRRDAGCTGAAHSSESFRVTARLAAPFACEGELGARRLLYCDNDPDTGCRIYTRDPAPAGDPGDEDALYG